MHMRFDSDYLAKKNQYFNSLNGRYKTINKKKIKWFYNNNQNAKLKVKVRLLDKKLQRIKLPLYISFIRWMIIDFIRCKQKKFFGIYTFIALPGEGKTLSMVAHMERVKKEYPDILIATNFDYIHENAKIRHWSDMVKIAVDARNNKRKCLLAMDEIHVTFDSADWKNFPAELLSLFSFNRKYNMQFICSAQIYDRVPKKIRDITNYVIVCKNMLHSDRLFRNYYYAKTEYEKEFDGKKKKASFIREYVASDNLYRLYDTKKTVERLVDNAEKERNRKEDAINLLFGKLDDD